MRNKIPRGNMNNNPLKFLNLKTVVFESLKFVPFKVYND